MVGVCVGDYLGIDVGARWCHYVNLDRDGAVRDVGYIDPTGPAGLLRLASRVDMAAIDGPDKWADDLHADDSSVAPKFRRRCAEFALRRRNYAVSWATEEERTASAWQRTSIMMYQTADDSLGPERVIEV